MLGLLVYLVPVLKLFTSRFLLSAEFECKIYFQIWRNQKKWSLLILIYSSTVICTYSEQLYHLYMWHMLVDCYSNWYIGTCDLSCFSINNSCWRPQRKATHLQAADQSSAQILQLPRGETSFNTVEEIVVIWSCEDKQIFLPMFPWLIFSDVQWLLGEDQLVSGCSSEE